MVTLFFYIICICLYYLICVYVFIGYTQLKVRQERKSFKKIDERYRNFLLNELTSYEKNSVIHDETIRKIKKQMRRKKYERYALHFLASRVEKEEDVIVGFINETNLLEHMIKRGDKTELDKAYKIKLIGKFKIKNQETFLVESCDSTSIYVQINGLIALGRLGNVESFVTGLKRIVQSSTLMNKKVISDKINKFAGDRSKLNKTLEKELQDGNELLTSVILEHFNNICFEDAKDTVYGLLCHSHTSKEVKLSCIKYFIKIKHRKVKGVLIQLLQDDNWELRALSCAALRHFPQEDVRFALKIAIKDENWYVRHNAAKTLLQIVKDKKEFVAIINGADKYAADAILVVLSEENRLEEFLHDMNVDEQLKKRLELIVSEVNYFKESLA